MRRLYFVVIWAVCALVFALNGTDARARGESGDSRFDCGRYVVAASDPGPKTIVLLKNDRVIRICNLTNKTVVNAIIDGQMFQLSNRDSCVDVEGQKAEVEFNPAGSSSDEAKGAYCLPQR